MFQILTTASAFKAHSSNQGTAHTLLHPRLTFLSQAPLPLQEVSLPVMQLTVELLILLQV